jgi:hypothetical protein
MENKDKNFWEKSPIDKKVVVILSLWSFIHLVIFVMSFNSYRYLKTYFFPFFDWDNYEIGGHHLSTYDLSEFLVYVGGAWLVFFLYKYLTKKV